MTLLKPQSSQAVKAITVGVWIVLLAYVALIAKRVMH